VLDERGDAIRLATDLAYEGPDGDRAEVAVDDIDEKTDGYLDVGSETIAAYEPPIHESDAVFVKGALGVFEDERFADGTVGVLEAIAETDCFSVVGGGDTSRGDRDVRARRGRLLARLHRGRGVHPRADGRAAAGRPWKSWAAAGRQ